MSARSPYFWEDAQQASERLTNTYVLHGDTPFFVQTVSPGDGETPSAIGRAYPLEKSEIHNLDDPAFHRFRKLPPVGWVNCERYSEGLYLERRPIRSRVHGLNDNNVRVGFIPDQAVRLSFGDFSFESVVKDPAYAQCCVGEYPSLEETLSCIRSGTTIAISNKYAVKRDSEGLRWLYRLSERVGLFSGNASLLLANSSAYLREELVEDPAISVENIQEF